MMPIRGSPAMTLRVRAVSDEEREALGRMARSRSLGAGLVRRAQIVAHALEGLKAPEISARMGLCGATVRHRLKRFNARGLDGLGEDVRTGRPPTYPAEQGSAALDAALGRPADPGRRLVGPAGPRAERARQEIGYGRRGAAGHVFGASRPATGGAFALTYER